MILGNCDQNQCYTSLSPVTIFEKNIILFKSLFQPCFQILFIRGHITFFYYFLILMWHLASQKDIPFFPIILADCHGILNSPYLYLLPMMDISKGCVNMWSHLDINKISISLKKYKSPPRFSYWSISGDLDASIYP